MRWRAVEICDAAVFALAELVAVEFFKATGKVRPLLAVARASSTWRRALAWLFCAPA